MSPAMKRAQEMMTIPMRKLPPLALEFAEYTCKQVGMCSEVLLTCWAVYAQLVEGLECDDSLYLARTEDKAWFDAHTVI